MMIKNKGCGINMKCRECGKESKTVTNDTWGLCKKCFSLAKKITEDLNK